MLIVLTGVLLSCQTQQKLVIPMYEPARLELPPQINRFLVTSRYVPASGPYDEIQEGYYRQVDSAKWNMALTLTDTLYQLINDDTLYMALYQKEPRMLRHNGPDLPKALPWEGTRNILNEIRVLAAVVLEGFDIEAQPVSVESVKGSWLAKREIKVITAFRIYEPYLKRMLDDSVYTWNWSASFSGSTQEEAIDGLPNERDAMYQALYHAANGYLSLFRPKFVPQTRWLFPEGDPKLVEAIQHIKEGNWIRAEARWKQLAYQSEDTLIQARASFNMAVACERNGRLAQGLAFARRSQRLHPDNKTLKYVNILNAKVMRYDDRVADGEIIRNW